jgi:hypothetical protein
MQPDTPDVLRQFHEFLGEMLSNGQRQLSPEEALDQWRVLHPHPDELVDSVNAVRQALADMALGDKGRPLDDVIADLRARHNLPS